MMKSSLLRKGVQWSAMLGGGILFLGCVRANTPVVVEKSAHPAPSTQVSSAVPVVPAASPAAPAKTEPLPLPETLENLSPGMAEILKLVQAHVGEEVIVAYVEKANFTFSPSADEILYLNDLGVSDKVMTAILHHSQTPPAVAPAVSPENTPLVATIVDAPNPLPAPAVSTPPEPTKSAPEPSTTPPAATTQTSPAATVIVVPPPAQPEVTVDYFYRELAPYGTWMEVDGYGRCWRPSVVVTTPHWQPYGDRGRWIYSDCGWYWQSDYSWGWAAFHYGRWHRSLHVGWVWVPDVTWGPSWVSWRRGDDYCGWAPLPPAARYHSGIGFSYRDSHVGINFDFGLTSDCYTFVPTRRFCDPHPYRYRASAAHRTAIFSHTTVNNHYTVNNNVIINRGIAPKVVADASGQEVRTVALKTTRDHPSSRPERWDRKANTLAVYRPPLDSVASTAPTAPPRRGETRRTPSVAATSSTSFNNSEHSPFTAPTVPSAPRLSVPPSRPVETGQNASARKGLPTTATQPEPSATVVIPQNEKPSSRVSATSRGERTERNTGTLETRSARTPPIRISPTESRSRVTPPPVTNPAPSVSTPVQVPAPRAVVSQPVTENPTRVRPDRSPSTRISSAPSAPVFTAPSRQSEPRPMVPEVRATSRSASLERPATPAPAVRFEPTPASPPTRISAPRGSSLSQPPQARSTPPSPSRQEPPQRTSEGRTGRDRNAEGKR